MSQCWWVTEWVQKCRTTWINHNYDYSNPNRLTWCRFYTNLCARGFGDVKDCRQKQMLVKSQAKGTRGTRGTLKNIPGKLDQHPVQYLFLRHFETAEQGAGLKLGVWAWNMWTFVTPWVKRSSEYSHKNVVFPFPVPPVKTVISPGRSPPKYLFSTAKRFHCKIQHLLSQLSLFVILVQIRQFG